jgi:hypothetical protein
VTRELAGRAETAAELAGDGERCVEELAGRRVAGAHEGDLAATIDDGLAPVDAALHVHSAPAVA